MLLTFLFVLRADSVFCTFSETATVFSSTISAALAAKEESKLKKKKLKTKKKFFHLENKFKLIKLKIV
ncbi:MAG: hypothetical protein COZ18_06225 [Flexibacter sp. CG_4_10_14_3_um_filter_32_15]|nr:MAG: hypothetical protein COZ18_06225 [Flexibacter sp. CG_4_10_14_3_um_filter_32_15]